MGITANFVVTFTVHRAGLSCTHLGHAVVGAEVSRDDGGSAAAPLLLVEQLLGQVEVLDGDHRVVPDEVTHDLVLLPQVHRGLGPFEGLAEDREPRQPIREFIGSSCGYV